jgi:hypothetical protein
VDGRWRECVDLHVVIWHGDFAACHGIFKVMSIVAILVQENTVSYDREQVKSLALEECSYLEIG